MGDAYLGISCFGSEAIVAKAMIFPCRQVRFCFSVETYFESTSKKIVYDMDVVTKHFQDLGDTPLFHVLKTQATQGNYLLN